MRSGRRPLVNAAAAAWRHACAIPCAVTASAATVLPSSAPRTLSPWRLPADWLGFRSAASSRLQSAQCLHHTRALSDGAAPLADYPPPAAAPPSSAATAAAASCTASRYASYADARQLMRELQIPDAHVFQDGVWGDAEGSLHPCIPQAPDVQYADAGWAGWDDFLGVTPAKRKRRRQERRESPKHMEIMPFDEARTVAHTLGLTGRSSYYFYVLYKYSRVHRPSADGQPLPETGSILPYRPDKHYADAGWVSWDDFVGNHLQRQWRPFNAARGLARDHGFRSTRDAWYTWALDITKRPHDVPYSPSQVYSDRWHTWEHFLSGKGQAYLPFEEALKLVRSRSFTSQQKYWAWIKLSEQKGLLPKSPQKEYAGQGWISWAHYFQDPDDPSPAVVANQPPAKRPPAARKRKVQPHTGPTKPKEPTMLGHELWSYEDALEYVQALDLKSKEEWIAFTHAGRIPIGIPWRPNKAYRREWRSWDFWLGLEDEDQGSYRGFEEAREVARSMGLSSQEDWEKIIARGDLPTDIPQDPATVYQGEGWVGYPDWLGYAETAPPPEQGYLQFEEARAIVRALKMTKGRWRKWATTERPRDIPFEPDWSYRGSGWTTWADWLDLDPPKHRKDNLRETLERKDYSKTNYLPFEEARAYVHKQELTIATWRTWVNNERPAFIPYYPHLRYENQGFVSMEDFLGESASRNRLEREESALRNPDYWDYHTARAYVRTLRLDSKVGFLAWCRMENKRPTRLPVSVRHVYRHHGTWVDWSDFLFVPKGQDPLSDPHLPPLQEQAELAPPTQLRQARSTHLPFEDSRYLVRLAGLTTVDAYEAWWKAGHCPSDIPFRPDITYVFRGWNGWDDWLGTEPGTVPYHKRMLGRRRQRVKRPVDTAVENSPVVPKRGRVEYGSGSGSGNARRVKGESEGSAPSLSNDKKAGRKSRGGKHNKNEAASEESTATRANGAAVEGTSEGGASKQQAAGEAKRREQKRNKKGSQGSADNRKKSEDSTLMGNATAWLSTLFG